MHRSFQEGGRDGWAWDVIQESRTMVGLPALPIGSIPMGLLYLFSDSTYLRRICVHDQSSESRTVVRRCEAHTTAKVMTSSKVLKALITGNSRLFLIML
jgi:hypothetical protein